MVHPTSGEARFFAGLILVLVIVGGAELFTGNNLMVMAWASGRVPLVEMLRAWDLGLHDALCAAVLDETHGAAQEDDCDDDDRVLGITNHAWLALPPNQCNPARYSATAFRAAGLSMAAIGPITSFRRAPLA